MNYSAILVVANPNELDDVLKRIETIRGVEVHYVDRDGNRAICTIEAPNLDEEVACFTRVRETPGVFDTSLIEHRPDAL